MCIVNLILITFILISMLQPGVVYPDYKGLLLKTNRPFVRFVTSILYSFVRVSLINNKIARQHISTDLTDKVSLLDRGQIHTKGQEITKQAGLLLQSLEALVFNMKTIS